MSHVSTSHRFHDNVDFDNIHIYRIVQHYLQHLLPFLSSKSSFRRSNRIKPTSLLPIQILRDGNLPHRNHLLATSLTLRLRILARRNSSNSIIIPSPMYFFSALIDTVVGGALGVIVEEARARRILLHVGKPLRSGGSARGDAGANGGAKMFAAAGAEDGEAGGEDADVGFDVEPDAWVDDGVCERVSVFATCWKLVGRSEKLDGCHTRYIVHLKFRKERESDNAANSSAVKVVLAKKSTRISGDLTSLPK